MPNLPQTRRRPPRRLRLLAAAIGLAMQGARAQTAPGDGLDLQPSGDMVQHLPTDARSLEPAFVRADRIDGQTDITLDASGGVELRKHDVVLKGDVVHQDLVENEVQASGDVRILSDGNLFTGPSLSLNIDTDVGSMPQASYAFGRTGGHGEADRIDFVGRDHVQATNATYSTCTANPLDWFMQASHLDLDYGDDTGVATDGRIVFKGATILPLPYASFPLTDERKSGLLPPTLSMDSHSGFDYAQPYYWNIAPNYDATLTPQIMSRRGFMGSAAVRWLQPGGSGSSNIDLMPSDSGASGAERWAATLQQSGTLAPSLTYGLNLQRVSDNNWWQDFPDVDPVIAANRTLPLSGQLSWAQDNGSLTASFSDWQTQQNAVSPIAVPYDVREQLAGNWHSADYTGLQWDVQSAAARFYNVTPGMATGERVYLNPSLSRPFIAPQGYVTPKLSFNTTLYQTDQPMADGSTSATRSLPTFSLDSGLTFERSAQWFGHAVTQTLEPRLYYVYTPYRAQQNLPNYDSGTMGLNLATIYTDNVFSGNDRIADADNVTAGVTSRFVDAADGSEYARLTVAQRVLLKPQQVTLTGAPVPQGLNDTYALASLALDPRWNLDSGIDYNLRQHQLAAGSLSARWQPGPFRNLSFSYQTQSASATQIALKYVDVAWQWPIAPRWYSVGQLNYSLLDRQINSSLIGAEYDGGCWVARVVLQRNSQTVQTSNTRIMFQLELSGLSRLGMNPLAALEQNIPGYQLLNQPTAPASRYANYE